MHQPHLFPQLLFAYLLFYYTQYDKCYQIEKGYILPFQWYYNHLLNINIYILIKMAIGPMIIYQKCKSYLTGSIYIKIIYINHNKQKLKNTIIKLTNKSKSTKKYILYNIVDIIQKQKSNKKAGIVTQKQSDASLNFS